jgi:hypothetical protein
MANSCPNYQGIPSCKFRAYLLEVGLLAQFVDDRPKCESSESLGMCAVAPKSE